MVNPEFWKRKRVFLTGHTGFKGSWLSLWLQRLGAQVTGYALPPATQPNLFDVAAVAEGMTSIIGDIRDLPQLQSALTASEPQIIFHLAAQALVKAGYQDPIGTYTTNIIGTANLLEAARKVKSLQAVVVVTSDKCYENKEWARPYHEDDPLGGHDPYSSSKACAELVTASYRKSFLAESGVALASARAGNVLGGGDWSPDRLIPDLLAAFSVGQPALIRNPASCRPWQHVLEPLAAYLHLAQRMNEDASLASAWNFGPNESDCLSVGEIADRLAKHWGRQASWQTTASDFPHEARSLRLNSSSAKARLDWRPRWGIDQALSATAAWHKAWLDRENMRHVTLNQIEQFNDHANA